MPSPLGNSLPVPSSRPLPRLLGCGNSRCIARNDWHLLAGVCTRCFKRKTAAETPSLGMGISNIGWSRGRVFGSDGCCRLAPRKSSNRGLAYLDYSDCKRGCRAAVPSQLGLGDCWGWDDWLAPALIHRCLLRRNPCLITGRRHSFCFAARLRPALIRASRVLPSAPQKVYWLTISCRGETGGERSQKSRSLHAAF